MKMISWLVTCAAGAVAGVALVVACGDDTPSDADAAVCDCPPAEAPLAGRITRVTDMRAVPANTADSATVSCPANAVLLGGGCRHLTSTNDLLVLEAGPRAGGEAIYRCKWKNESTTEERTGVVEAICLTPAP